MGKAPALARDEVLRSAQTLRFYAVEGQSFSGETFPNDDPDMLVYSAREPLGVVSAIAPWKQRGSPRCLPPNRSRTFIPCLSPRKLSTSRGLRDSSSLMLSGGLGRLGRIAAWE